MISSLNDVRPGDIMISHQSTAPNKIIVYGGQLLMGDHFRIGPFAAGHAGVVTPGMKLVEAMPSGARERDLFNSDWSNKHMYFRLPEDYPGQHLDVACVARAMIGVPYSFMSYAYLAAYRFGFKFERLAKHINRRHSIREFPFSENCPYGAVKLPIEAICSVLADQAWTLTGKKVIHNTRAQVVTPGMLARTLWLDPEVIRGWGS